MLKVNKQAIDFILKNQNDETVKLSNFLGKKVVLYFYPKDDTPGCTVEACGLRDVYDDILDAGAVVMGVSADSVASHTKFRNKFDLPFHLLADTERTVCTAYGAWEKKKTSGETHMGSNRITYIIDEKGVIEHVWAKVTPKTHADEILDVLRK